MMMMMMIIIIIIITPVRIIIKVIRESTKAAS
jgi:hypothetical protein